VEATPKLIHLRFFVKWELNPDEFDFVHDAGGQVIADFTDCESIWEEIVVVDAATPGVSYSQADPMKRREMSIGELWRKLVTELERDGWVRAAVEEEQLMLAVPIPSIELLEKLTNNVLAGVLISHGLRQDDEPNAYGRWVDDKISDALRIIYILQDRKEESGSHS